MTEKKQSAQEWAEEKEDEEIINAPLEPNKCKNCGHDIIIRVFSKSERYLHKNNHSIACKDCDPRAMIDLNTGACSNPVPIL